MAHAHGRGVPLADFLLFYIECSRRFIRIGSRCALFADEPPVHREVEKGHGHIEAIGHALTQPASLGSRATLGLATFNVNF